MTKSLLIFTLALTTALHSFAQSDFRKGQWGDSRATIIEAEGNKPLTKATNEYEFKDSIESRACIVKYTFFEGELFRGQYKFTDKYSDSSDFVYDYESLKELLSKKYGWPNEKDVEERPIRIDNRENAETLMLLNIGNITLSTTWRTKTTIITLSLGKVKDRLQILIDYQSIELEEVYTQKLLEKL